jgi:hypothetical protein
MLCSSKACRTWFVESTVQTLSSSWRPPRSSASSYRSVRDGITEVHSGPTRSWHLAVQCMDLNAFHVLAERNPPIVEVINQGVIPQFVKFLQRYDMPPLQVFVRIAPCLR